MATLVLTGEIRESVSDVTSKTLYTFYQSIRSNEKANLEIELPTGSEDEGVEFPQVGNSCFVAVSTDKVISVKVHPFKADEEIPDTLPEDLSAISVSTVFILVGNFHKLFLSNSSGSTANVKITILGERATT